MNKSGDQIFFTEEESFGRIQHNDTRECLWVLYGDEHKKIQLTIVALNISTSVNDSYESFQVRSCLYAFQPCHEKPVFGVSDKLILKSACSVTVTS